MKTACKRKPTLICGVLLLVLLAAAWFCAWLFSPVYGLEEMVAVQYCEIDGQVAKYIENRPESRFDRLKTRLAVGELYAVRGDTLIYTCAGFPEYLAVTGSGDTGYTLCRFDSFCTPEELALIGDDYAKVP